MALGLYPSAFAAFSTLARVLAETDAPSVKVRDTAERETPALFRHLFQGYCHRLIQIFCDSSNTQQYFQKHSME
jgi:Tat protein secretion system quality control protein TatD with DNase activity